MDGGVAKLQGALIHSAVSGIHPDVLRLAVFSPHTAQVCHPQTPVGFDLGHHSAQGIGMGLQQQGVVFVFAAKLSQHAALIGETGGITKRLKFGLHPPGGLFRKAGGTVYPQQRNGLIRRKFCVFPVHFVSLCVMLTYIPPGGGFALLVHHIPRISRQPGPDIIRGAPDNTPAALNGGPADMGRNDAVFRVQEGVILRYRL